MKKLIVDEATSRRLGKIRQKGTEPELILRRALAAEGLRFRTSARDLPGSPDLANRSALWAVWVHGCFWHHHAGCSRATIPKRNRDFWLEKFAANRLRDRRVRRKLEALGYFCATFWECELNAKPKAVAEKVRRLIAHATNQGRDSSG